MVTIVMIVVIIFLSSMEFQSWLARVIAVVFSIVVFVCGRRSRHVEKYLRVFFVNEEVVVL